jgi:hypothetical protein
LKRALLIGCGVVVITGLAGVIVVANRSHKQALAAFYHSRPLDSRDSDYAIVTRGVRLGMSPGEVNQRMGRPQNSRTLVTNSESATEPYMAVFYFAHESDRVFGLKLQHPHIAEYYSVFFDPMKHATRMEYLVFDKMGDTQEIDIDLKARTLSEPLKVPWPK